MTNQRTGSLSTRKSTTRSRLKLRSSGASKPKVPMAKAGKIPAGAYRSKIVSIKAKKTTAGDEAVEVIYDLITTDGQKFLMREVIPVDSWAFELFCDALIAAGMSEDDDLTAAVGIEEAVELHYPDPRGFGRFKRRTPITGSAEEVAAEAAAVEGEDVDDADDEFDDFLEDDEDEDDDLEDED